MFVLWPTGKRPIFVLVDPARRAPGTDPVEFSSPTAPDRGPQCALSLSQASGPDSCGSSKKMDGFTGSLGESRPNPELYRVVCSRSGGKQAAHATGSFTRVTAVFIKTLHRPSRSCRATKQTAPPAEGFVEFCTRSYKQELVCVMIQQDPDLSNRPTWLHRPPGRCRVNKLTAPFAGGSADTSYKQHPVRVCLRSNRTRHRLSWSCWTSK